MYVINVYPVKMLIAQENINEKTQRIPKNGNLILILWILCHTGMMISLKYLDAHKMKWLMIAIILLHNLALQMNNAENGVKIF